MPAAPSLFDSVTALRVAALVVAVVTAWRPGWGLGLLLVALPLAIHHPSAQPTFWLVMLLAVFEVVYLVRVRPSPRAAAVAIGREPLLLIGVLFVAAAAASLTSLPVVELWREHAAVARFEAPSAWPARVADIIRLPESRPEFAVVSTALALQGLVLALIVRREVRRSPGLGVGLCLAVAVGLAGIMGLGLLEAGGWVSLARLRGNEFMILRPNTLQSAAGNPGWYAEYVVYALPHGLALLALGTSSRLGRAPLAGVVSLALFTLATAFQRGGWIAGAVTIGYMTWAGRRLHRQGRVSRPAGTWRRLGSLAVGCALLALALTGVWAWRTSAPGEGRPDGTAFLERLVSITKSERLDYWRIGAEMVALHPVLGAGHESFALRHLMYYQSEGGVLAVSRVRVPEAASAHSVYVQTATGTGLVGLALLLGLFGAAAWTVARGVRAPEPDQDRRRQAILLAGGGSLLGVAVYGLAQEVFYVHALRVLFFLGLGMVAAMAPARTAWPPRAALTLWAGLAMLVVVHLVYEYRWPGPNRLFAPSVPAGVAGEEQGPSGETFRWTTIVATWPVPDGASTVSLRVRSVAPFAQTVEIAPCNGPPVRTVLSDQTWRGLEARLQDCGPGDRVWLRASPGWRPGGYGGLLGVMVSDVHVQ